MFDSKDVKFGERISKNFHTFTMLHKWHPNKGRTKRVSELGDIQKEKICSNGSDGI